MEVLFTFSSGSCFPLFSILVITQRYVCPGDRMELACVLGAEQQQVQGWVIEFRSITFYGTPYRGRPPARTSIDCRLFATNCLRTDRTGSSEGLGTPFASINRDIRAACHHEQSCVYNLPLASAAIGEISGCRVPTYSLQKIFVDYVCRCKYVVKHYTLCREIILLILG